jgi:hypothetical protein
MGFVSIPAHYNKIGANTLTKEQLEMIVALLAGHSAAIVHLSLKVAEIGELDKKKFADSYRKTASLLDDAIRNRDVIAMTLNQIANGMDSAQPETPDDIAASIRKLLH